MATIKNFVSGLHYSREFEKCVLGVCLLHPLATKSCTLAPDDFYDDNHAKVFIALREMVRQSIPIDLLTCWQYLLKNGVATINNFNTSYYLTTLTNEVILDTHFDYWCSVIKQMKKKRMQLSETITGKKPTTPTKWKTPPFARFFLKFATKEALKHTSKLYGLPTIAGSGGTTVQVENKQWVYLMHLIDPSYTWTTGNDFDAIYSKPDCIAALPKNKRLHLVNNILTWL